MDNDGKQIVFLLGMPRSNTTIIHRTLAQHPSVFAPTLSDLLFPFRALSNTLGRSVFRSIPQGVFNKIYNPDIHKTGPSLPEALDAAIFKKYKRGVLAWVHMHALRGEEQPRFAEEDIKYIQQLCDFWIGEHPGKKVCLKYFHGIEQMRLLKTYFPNAQYIISLRDPEKLVKSSATLIQMIMDVRGKTPSHDYWRLIYRNIVLGYEKLLQVVDKSPNIYLSLDYNIKNNISLELESMAHYMGISSSSIQAPSSYTRKYEYSNRLDELFNKKDFESYYDFLEKRV